MGTLPSTLQEFNAKYIIKAGICHDLETHYIYSCELFYQTFSARSISPPPHQLMFLKMSRDIFIAYTTAIIIPIDQESSK